MAEKPKVERAKASGLTKEEIIAEIEKNLAGMDPDKFENESRGEDPERTPEEDAAEVEAVDDMLEGRDEKFDKLKY